MSTAAPPPYEQPAAAQQAAISRSRPVSQQEQQPHSQHHLGFPAGYFCIQSHQASSTSSTLRRVWDVIGGKTENGTKIGLYEQKEPVWMRAHSHPSLQNSWNNQLFYLTWDGSLASASADGRRVDCIDSSLSISTPYSISSIPSAASHPHPQLAYDSATCTLRLIFSVDPAFPSSSSSSSSAASSLDPSSQPHSNHWKEYDYLVESVPKKGKVVGGSEDLGVVLGLFGKLFGSASTADPLASIPSSSSSSSRLVTNEFSHTSSSSSSSMAARTGEDDEDSDDDLQSFRELKVVRLHASWRDKFPMEALRMSRDSEQHCSGGRRGALGGEDGERSLPSKEVRKWRRRQFSIIPIVAKRDENGAGGSSGTAARNFDRLSGNSSSSSTSHASTSSYPGGTSSTNGPRMLRLAASATVPLGASSASSPSKGSRSAAVSASSSSSSASSTSIFPAQASLSPSSSHSTMAAQSSTLAASAAHNLSPSSSSSGAANRWSLLGIPLQRPRSSSSSSSSTTTTTTSPMDYRAAPMSDAAGASERERLEREEYDEMAEFVPKSLGDYDDAREVKDVTSDMKAESAAFASTSVAGVQEDAVRETGNVKDEGASLGIGEKASTSEDESQREANEEEDDAAMTPTSMKENSVAGDEHEAEDESAIAKEAGKTAKD